MAEKQEMEITIDKDGQVQIHVQGVDGKSCLELTKDLEEALGVVTTREKTGDYFKEEDKQESHIYTGESE
ncbi:MAG: DUF2997 domain-containing protein [Spirochaetales bacterium]|nr:DUF2997 domain-containing protein [Spirochaetales bacterium]